jgi:TFIIF-interacting CTD phosphatase-like protein
MSDISSYTPIATRHIDHEDLLTDEQVDELLDLLIPPHREKLVRHMMAAEQKASQEGYTRGRSGGPP